MIRYLTVEQVLFIHARIIDETGGRHGVRDLGLLEAAVMRSRATYEGKELYPDVYLKAAALLHSLTGNHPFVDGNKRTGIAAAALFMAQNGYRLVASNPELEDFVLAAVISDLEIREIAAWVEENCQPA